VVKGNRGDSRPGTWETESLGVVKECGADTNRPVTPFHGGSCH
jgi:hypothetical protein